MHSKHIYHYVYRITNISYNMHYYGSRSTKNLPKEDLGIKYFSSSKDKSFIKDQKKNPKNYKYKILKIFDNRKKAIQYEIMLHDKFNVAVNKSFYNKAKQTSDKWDSTDMVCAKWADNRNDEHFMVSVFDERYLSGELVSIFYKTRMGKNNPMYGKKGQKCPFYGIKRTDETKKKMREKRKETYKILICPYCKKEGESRAMKRWHFSNCGKTNGNKGSNNGKAKIINIYNAFGFLIFKCHGNFAKICKENNLPVKALMNSYKNNGKPIFQSPASKGKAIKAGLGFQIGYYAIIVNEQMRT